MWEKNCAKSFCVNSFIFFDCIIRTSQNFASSAFGSHSCNIFFAFLTLYYSAKIHSSPSFPVQQILLSNRIPLESMENWFLINSIESSLVLIVIVSDNFKLLLKNRFHREHRSSTKTKRSSVPYIY